MPSALTPAAGLTLRTVRMHGAADGLRARHGLEAALSGVADQAEGWLLVVRHLTTLAARPDRLRRAVETGVADRLAQARRPWSDPDAATGEAVLFADAAQMLACLARDWLHGRAQTWFWRAVLRGVAAEPALHDLAAQRGDLVPPALALLASAGEAAAWTARLPDAAANVIAAAVATAHAIGPLAIGSGGGSHRPQARMPAPADTAGEPGPSGSDATEAVHRLRAVVPEVTLPGPGPAQRRLLGVALALHRAPALARGAAFPAALETLATMRQPPLTSYAATTRRAGSLTGSPPASVPNAPTPPAGPGEIPGTPVEQQLLAPVAEDRTDTIGHIDLAPSGSAIVIPPVAQQRTAPPPSAPAPRAQAATPRDLASTPAGPIPTASPGRSTPDAASPVSAVPWFRPTETGLGGLFYLLNAALAFGLYSDFTRPLATGLTLLPWEFLALAGRHWFGETAVRDPVWALLAQLAGRPAQTPPGSGFTPPPTWAVPPGWLPETGALATAGVHVTRRRVCLLHPDGFVLAQAPRRENEAPRAAARVMAKAYPALRDARLIRSTQAALPRGARARWLAIVLQTMAARLARALDVSPADAPILLCRHRARVSVTASAIGVHLSLAELPLAIRMAGLDRDPGWIPAAGRSVTFHFE